MHLGVFGVLASVLEKLALITITRNHKWPGSTSERALNATRIG